MMRPMIPPATAPLRMSSLTSFFLSGSPELSDGDGTQLNGLLEDRAGRKMNACGFHEPSLGFGHTARLITEVIRARSAGLFLGLTHRLRQTTQPVQCPIGSPGEKRKDLKTFGRMNIRSCVPEVDELWCRTEVIAPGTRELEETEWAWKART